MTERASDMVSFVCESVSCLDPSAVRELGIRVLPVPFVIDGRTHLDGVDSTAEEFYAYLERSGRAPATSAPSPAAYLEAFRQAETPDIICVTVSAAVSTIAERCRLAIQMAREELPDRRIAIFDSGNAAMAEGFLALEGARAARAGASVDEVLQLLRRRRAAAHLLITLDTLKYLAQTGRLQAIAAMAGGLFSIKPLVHVNDDKFTPVEVCRTRRRAVERLLDRLVRAATPALPAEIAVQHAAAPAEAEQLRARVLERLPGARVSVVPFSPVMGSYAGPGLLGFAWLQPER